MKLRDMLRITILVVQLVVWATVAWSQIQITTHVLPPYQSRISEYASRPELMLITVTNTTVQSQQIQLTAKITGDNGVSAWVKPGYRSPSAIVLGPNQTVSLNGSHIAQLFDVNTIEYTGISRADMNRGLGLLEGNYTLCIRALNYNTLSPISPNEPIGCTMFRIADLEPPRILMPFDKQKVDHKGVQALPMTWTTPPTSSPDIRYKVKIVEMLDVRNPNDAIQTTRPLYEETVQGNSLIYGPAQPALIQGRQYAMMVQAIDPVGKSNFRNRGMSEVTSFVYGENSSLERIGNKPMQVRSNVVNPAPDCGCKSVDNNTATKALAIRDIVKIGDGSFDMTVNSLQGTSAGGYSGTGTVTMPVIGSVSGMKIRVNFAGLKANVNNRMYEGVVRGTVKLGAPSFMPKTDQPDLSGLSLTSSEIGQMDDFLKNNSSQLVSQVSNATNTLGFELPLGVAKGPITIAIHEVYFNAYQAWFNASTAMDLPDAGPGKRLALSGRDFCFTKDDFCKEGILSLAEDFDVQALSMTLLATTNDTQGTHIAFDAKGFKSLGIVADYTFPTQTLVKASNPQEALKARLTATTTSGWSNWVAAVTVDPFLMTGVADFKFSLVPGKSIIYDHSDSRNATQSLDGMTMPNSLTIGDNQMIHFSNDWKGFYIPEIQIELPSSIKSNVGGSPTFKAIDFVFDTQRGEFSGRAGVADLLKLQDGNLDGWYFSIDHIDLNFFKNAFVGGGMDGKLMLPISGEYAAHNNSRKEISYDCTLSKPQGAAMSFQFNVQVKNDLDFDAFWAKASIKKGSNIVISAGGGQSFKAEATLNGSLNIIADINGLPDVTLGHVGFTNMKISSSGPTLFSPGQFTAGIGPANTNAYGGNAQMDAVYAYEEAYLMRGPFASDNVDQHDVAASGGSQESLMGFNFTIRKWTPYMDGGHVGVTFDTYMELVNGVNFVPKADMSFSIYAKPQNGTRRFWNAAGGKVNAVNLQVDADLAGMKISGKIGYFDISSGRYKDRGFSGLLTVDLPIAQVAMKGMFGSRKETGKNTFQFFYVDGLLDLKNRGIPMFPGTALYGFAGGAYYNMERKSLGNIYEQINGAPSTESRGENSYNTIKSFSGVEYIPISGNTNSSVGFMAGIYFGLESRAVLDAEASLTIGFVNGSFNQVALNGRVAIMNNMASTFEERFKHAMITGEIGVGVEFLNREFKKFEANMTVNLKYPVFSPMIEVKNGGMSFLIENGAGWYLKMGTPWNVPTPGPMELTVNTPLFKIGAKSYFQVGTMRIDDIPPIPIWITNIIKGANTKKRSEENSRLDQVAEVMPKNRRTTEKASTEGFITGLEIGFDADPQFLIFYAHLKAGLGADLSLKYYPDGPCGNYNESLWYAKGNAFVGAEASCGIRVSIFGIKKNIVFVEAGLAASVTAGLPKPFYAKGRMGGYFSVLGGLISKNFRIGFEVGTVCESLTGNPEELALIEEIYPASGDDFSILDRPAVSFNYSLSGDFVVPLEFEDKDGMPYTVYQLFRFKREDVTVTMVGDGKTYAENEFVLPHGNNKITRRGMVKDIYSIQLDNKMGMLKPETTYTLNVEAGVSRLKFTPLNSQSRESIEALANTGESFTAVLSDDGKIYKDKRPAVRFKTGKGPKRILIDNVIETFPYHRGNTTPYRAFQSIDGQRGYLNLLIGQPGRPSYFDTGLKDDETQVKIRFVMLESGGEVNSMERDVRVSGDGRRWEFDMPVLAPNTTYAAKIYFKKINRGTAGLGVGTNLAVRRTINLTGYGGGQVEISGRQLVTDALRMTGGDHELFAWYFKTGQKETYQKKYDNLRLLKTTISGTEINRGQKQVNMEKLNWHPDSTTKTMGGQMMVEYWYTVDEWFNKLDFTNMDRSQVLPTVADKSFTANEKAVWKAMLARSGMDPSQNFISYDREQVMWRDFVTDAFGADKTLTLQFMNFDGVKNAMYGIAPIRASSSVSFPNATSLLQTNLYDINFDNNHFSSSAGQSTNTSTMGGNRTLSTSVSTVQSYLNALERNGQSISSLNMTGSTALFGVTGSSVTPAVKITYAVSGGQSVGKGVLNTGDNMLQKLITFKKDQGYPTDIFKDLGGIGKAMDKTFNSMQNSPVQLQAPTGLQGPKVNIQQQLRGTR